MFIISFLLMIGITERPFPYLWEMTDEQKNNAIIRLSLPEKVSEEIKAVAKQIEHNWNTGNHEYALKLLSEHTEFNNAGYSIQWKSPIKSSILWGDDVLISQEDSLYTVDLAYDPSSGHLFSVIANRNSITFNWIALFSPDTGKTWTEVFRRSENYDKYLGIDCAVLAGYFWVAYEDYTYYVTVERFSAVDGSYDSSYATKLAVQSPGIAIIDVRLGSTNEFNPNGNIYCLALLTNQIVCTVSDTSGATWTELFRDNRSVAASRGPDLAVTNKGSTPYIWYSYIGENDSLYAGKYLDSLFKFGPFDRADTSINTFTSIAAIGDTVMCLYNRPNETLGVILYRITYNGGSNWYWSFTHDTSRYVAYQADITRKGENSLAYCFTGWATSNFSYSGWFRYRDFSVGFSDYEIFADNAPVNDIKPEIVEIDTATLGIAYISASLRRAFFDKRDWVGINEKTENTGLTLLQAPSMVRGSECIIYRTEKKAELSIVIYDVSGRVIRNIRHKNHPPGTHRENIRPPSTGIYLYRIKSGTQEINGKFIYLRM